MSANLGGSSSESGGSSTFNTDVWGPQGEALKGLYDQAANLYGGSNQFMDKITNAAQGAQNWGQDIMGDAQGGYQNMLGGGSFGDTSDIRNQLMSSLQKSSGGSNLGNMYNSIVGGEGNTYIDPMVDAMKQGAMENNAMLQSGNAMDASAMGQGGSSRHAMQNAMTNRMTNQDMMNQETAMRGGAYDKDLSMKMDIARQADQGVSNSQNMMMNMLQGADANRQAAMGMSGNMQNMGMSNMAPWMQAQQAQWNPMNNFANIIGGPTMTGSGQSSSSSSSKGAGGGAGLW